MLDELVESLLYEGYALYPYTPGAVKNATPTPFGIVYPPAYAADAAAAHDHLRLDCGLAAGTDVPLRATIRFLQATGEDHRAVEHRVELPAPGEAVPFEFDGISGRARLRVDPAEEGVSRVRCCVHNTTEVAAGIERRDVLPASLISTHVILEAPGSRFLSPLEHPEFESVNTFPVLASDADDTILGAAIVLPDHPQLAPESRGSLFDGTEIEEALLLHVQTLSDGEREAIADADPAVHAMIERAAAATPADLFDLHGVMHPTEAGVLSDPQEPHPSFEGWRQTATEDRPAEQNEPPRPPADLPNFTGKAEVTSDGVTYRLGARVLLRPDPEGDAIDHMLEGRTATIEKLLYDVDGRLYFGVTLDGDPGQELLRDTGRFMYFFEGEVEPV